MQANILVADDEDEIRKIISTALGLDGHEIFEAADGRAAVDLAFEIDPDLVILDVMMPRLDGFEALSLLRHHRKTRKTPVILLTAKTTERDRIDGLSLGADDYMPKPFSVEELRLRVEKRLQEVQEMKRLKSLAWADPVTDLGNRRSFGDAFDRWWERHTKHGTPISTVCVAIDQLETYVRSQPVFTADALLRRIGTALRSELEEREEGFDLGANRFVVLTPHTGQSLIARELRLSHSVERVLQASALGYRATVRSTSASPLHRESQESFLKRALSRDPEVVPRSAATEVNEVFRR
jgi:PleD family two-component response regulator